MGTRRRRFLKALRSSTDGSYTLRVRPSPLFRTWLIPSADFHPDQFYKAYSSTQAGNACHRGEGPAGVFGAETSDCDSPFSLVNSTFHWIDKHLKDSIDFIIWTGDSARHDSDEDIPRSERQVTELNEFMVSKFVEVFAKKDDDGDPMNDFEIPIIPNFGNNDILPHNIFTPGPNRWTKKYAKIWRKLIPESQRHVFERGGWFWVEVIPRKLAVFSLNTLYFFDSNVAVDGCAHKSEPGYEQMEWLRIQLQLLRDRGLKAILTGHVPPARTEVKQSWDETCWQKYTYWMHQYRDVVVGSVYGHMNIDHFMLQDSKDVDYKMMNGDVEVMTTREADDKLTIRSSAEYLSDLRTGWRRLPDSEAFHINEDLSDQNDNDLAFLRKKKKKKKPKRPKKSKKETYLEKIGGEWGERYSLSLVSPSVVPNYFPTMRVIEYNTSGLHHFAAGSLSTADLSSLGTDFEFDKARSAFENADDEETEKSKDLQSASKKKKRKKKHKHKKPKFTAPLPPSKASPPGPAHSPQTLTWLSITQYYANLTTINNDFSSESFGSSASSHPIDPVLDTPLDEQRWHEGKHSGEKPHHKKGHKAFQYEVEYDTKTDTAFNMTDLTVRSYLDLASRMGRYKPVKNFFSCDAEADGDPRTDVPAALGEGNAVGAIEGQSLTTSKKKGKKEKKKRKRRRRKENAKLWFSFVRRAYVGSRDEDELREEFGNG